MSLGAPPHLCPVGEIATMPTGTVIANAIFNATGKR